MTLDELQDDGQAIAACLAGESRWRALARVQVTLARHAKNEGRARLANPCLHETNSERSLTVAITT